MSRGLSFGPAADLYDAIRPTYPPAALHWAGGAGGQGLLLVGDSLTVVMDRRYLSFMYSYPNLIPLPADAVRRIAASVRPFAFERIYGAWDGRTVASAGKDAVERSAERYIRFLEKLPSNSVP